MTPVSVASGSSRRENLLLALRTLPADGFAKLASASSVLIKPNLVHHRNQLASTHVDAVRATIEFVREKTAAPITVADASYHGTKAAFRNFGYDLFEKEYPAVRLFDLNDDETVPGTYLKRDGSLGEMGIAKTAAEAGYTICLSVIKTHRDVGVSLTVKNWTIGTWVVKPTLTPFGKLWARSPYMHAQGNDRHHETIAELLRQMKPDLAVLDGFVAMEGDGPTNGEPVELGVALAGFDALAVDTVACGLMGIDPVGIRYLALAGQRGYGEGDRKRIELLGERDLSGFRKIFKRP